MLIAADKWECCEWSHPSDPISHLYPWWWWWWGLNALTALADHPVPYQHNKALYFVEWLVYAACMRVCFYLCLYLQPHHRLSWILNCSTHRALSDDCSHLFQDVTYCIRRTNVNRYDVEKTRMFTITKCAFKFCLLIFTYLVFFKSIGFSQTAIVPMF